MYKVLGLRQMHNNGIIEKNNPDRILGNLQSLFKKIESQEAKPKEILWVGGTRFGRMDRLTSNKQYCKHIAKQPKTNKAINLGFWKKATNHLFTLKFGLGRGNPSATRLLLCQPDQGLLFNWENRCIYGNFFRSILPGSLMNKCSICTPGTDHNKLFSPQRPKF